MLKGIDLLLSGGLLKVRGDMGDGVQLLVFARDYPAATGTGEITNIKTLYKSPQLFGLLCTVVK